MRIGFAALLGIALVFAGCRSAPLTDVTDAPVVVPVGKVATSEEVKTAIIKAGTRLGWQMSETRPGVIGGRIALRGNTANVDVRYSTRTYSIVYIDSSGLKAKDGQIHKNYNGWIENLDREIRVELLKI